MYLPDHKGHIVSQHRCIVSSYAQRRETARIDTQYVQQFVVMGKAETLSKCLQVCVS